MSGRYTACFLPENYLNRRAWRRSILASTTILCAILVGAELTWLLSQTSLRKLESQRTRLQRDYQAAEEKVARDRETQRKELAFVGEAQGIAALLTRTPASLILAELAAATPRSVSLTSAEVDWENRDNAVVTITATSDTVGGSQAMLARLKRSGLLANAVHINPDETSRHFQLRMSVNSSTPATAAAQPRRQTVMLDTGN